MEKRPVPGDPLLIDNIVKYLKAKGIFDEFRHECLADVDTKSSCQNLSQRVDGYTTKFLSGEKFHPDLNKNELRNKLRRHIDESGMLAGGADHVVEQVINPKINQLFLPKIIEVVHQYLNEELNKRRENSNDNIGFEKPLAENIDGANKAKSTKLDPIADILSFSYSKPKPNQIQNVQTKVADSTKTERKKDETLQQTKILEVLPKTEKKKEEPINPAKVSEVISKIKKEDTVLDVLQSIEKDKEESISVKIESVEPVNELSAAVPIFQGKSPIDAKELIKIKKEIKSEDSETLSDPTKKLLKDDIKHDKKKGELEKKKDDLKTSSDLNSLSEEGNQSKVVLSVPKSGNAVKNKSEPEKSKKIKPHNSSKSDTQKSKAKDLDKVSSKSSEKHKTASKISKISKDHASPHKNAGTPKSTKSDKADDSLKNKSKDSHSKLSDNSSKPLSSKSSSIKKDSTSVKLKSSDKIKASKSSDMKPNFKAQIDSSEKINKSNLQYSSYDSSQGSDQDKCSTSSQHKEKHKHFSKHHKKESNNKKSSEKIEKTPDKTRFQSDSDSGTPMKHKHGKHASEKEKKKSLSIQESAKISSRSNSFGSTSSVSDSPTSSSKEMSASTSEETSDNSLKSSKAKRKQDVKDYCKQSDDFPPPPPPPPTSGILAPGSSSAEVSSMDETQSSQESESDSKISDDESSSESDVENLYSSNSLKSSNLQTRLKTPDILNDVFDVFLYSSSSSEFEGYSSTPENVLTNSRQIDDVYVSSVHTSELSSFDDFLSESELSNSDIEEHRSTRRLTIKEAEKLLEEKAKQRRIERSKIVLPSKGSLDVKKSDSPQILPSALLSEDECSPVPEPKRESRRERKLNPKYASSEYASIFNSKKTSFITKQVSPNEDKSENISPAMSETSVQRQKDNSLVKRRISMGNLEANQLPDENTIKSPCPASSLQALEFSDKAKRKLSFEAPEESSWVSETKPYFNSHERNHNMIKESSDSHIALKIKKSVIKNDNQINKEPRPQGLKRKLTMNDKDDAKKVCRRNSENSSSSECVPNENNPFNVKLMEIKNKNFFHKQKINNNGVLKLEHVNKKSHPKPNHVIEKQSSD